MKQLIFAFAATLLLLSAGALHAECAFPSADGLAIPDGSQASKEESVSYTHLTLPTTPYV